ncbi:LamG-like jellyroll fold domain-containing protein [Arthrobacter sp. 4R501]|uniref:OmpL47-type beta-barrel domain-containing protein n=1 Tax=Arthrobacter sp. 4R501 TaxID=2058886 RepID=UPI000CE402C0|nr:LamG-like jellyroll fold domain-containing protein [Arthrobacter sp. 4R501]
MTRHTSPQPLLVTVALIAALAASTMGALPASAASAPGSYDSTVLADQPDIYWTMGNTGGGGAEPDLTGSGHTATYFKSPNATTLPNGDSAADFDGATQYLEAADSAELSPATNGVITIEAWMRPDALTFSHSNNGYVHWMGKGELDNHEYVSRMYSADNTVGRGNRISGYLFNASGGLGAGSYFQDAIVAGEWIHYVLVINYNAQSAQYPHGYTKIYRDGVLRDTDDLSISGTVIVPERGDAPFRVGTRDFKSFFDGAVGKVAFYDKELAPDRIAAHHQAMVQEPDTTAPVVNVALNPEAQDGANGWYAGPVQITATALDEVDSAPAIEISADGTTWVPFDGSQEFTDGRHVAFIRATDASGNRSDSVSTSFNVDSTSPDVAASASSSRRISLESSDGLSGIADVEYRIGAATAWTRYSEPFRVKNTTSTVTYRATDNAGNQTEAVLTLPPKGKPGSAPDQN